MYVNLRIKQPMGKHSHVNFRTKSQSRGGEEERKAPTPPHTPHPPPRRSCSAPATLYLPLRRCPAHWAQGRLGGPPPGPGYEPYHHPGFMGGPYGPPPHGPPPPHPAGPNGDMMTSLDFAQGSTPLPPQMNGPPGSNGGAGSEESSSPLDSFPSPPPQNQDFQTPPPDTSLPPGAAPPPASSASSTEQCFPSPPLSLEYSTPPAPPLTTASQGLSS